ncbi:hypothetical protein V2G26_007046 [Clonostachys chloroleuca]
MISVASTPTPTPSLQHHTLSTTPAPKRPISGIDYTSPPKRPRLAPSSPTYTAGTRPLSHLLLDTPHPKIIYLWLRPRPCPRTRWTLLQPLGRKLAIVPIETVTLLRSIWKKSPKYNKRTSWAESHLLSDSAYRCKYLFPSAKVKLDYLCALSHVL